MTSKKLRKLYQISLAVGPGLMALLALLFFMSAPAAQGAPLHQSPAPVLSVTKQGASNWQQRVKLVFTNTVAENLTDFPVLVVLSSTRISYANTQNAGQDIRFVDPDGTLLPHEIERWDESGNSYVWVKVPVITATSTTDYIWLYYGNAAAPDGQNPAAVWSAEHRGVWHFNGNTLDATTQNDGRSGSFTAALGGRIAGGLNFDGNGDFVNVDSDNSLDDIFATGGTIMAWINPRTFGPMGFGRILDKSNSINAGDGWSFQLFEEASQVWNTLRFERDDSDSDLPGGHPGGWRAEPNTIVTNTWQLLALTYNDVTSHTAPAIYINGAPKIVTSDWLPTSTLRSDDEERLFIGNFPGTPVPDRSFDGLMDEVRVLKTLRSADWIAAEYRSMTDDFIDYQSPEPVNETAGGIVGAPLTYTLTVSNSGGAATNVVIIDPLPAGANYVSGGQLVGGDTVSLIVGDVPANSSLSATFVVTTCQLALVNRDYQVVGTTTPGPLQISLLTTPTLTATFEAGPNPANLGQTVLFTDTSTTNGGPFTRHWAFGDGNTAQGLIASHAFTAVGSYTVTLTLTDVCGYTATAQKPVTIVNPALTVTKTAQPNPVTVGERLTYTVVISNGGLGPATGVVISDTLPGGVTLVPDSVQISPISAGGIVGSPPRLVENLTIAPQSSVTVTFAVTVAGPLTDQTQLTNTVAVTSNQTVTPVTATVTTLVTQPTTADVAISVLDAPDPVAAGGTLTYTLQVTNAGPGGSGPLTVTATLPPAAIFGTAQGNSWLCNHLAGIVTCTRSGMLMSGVAPLLNLTVTAPLIGQQLIFTATVDSETTDPLQANNVATATTTILGAPGISMAKSGPNFATVGQALVFTFTVTNSGSIPLQVQAINDDVAGAPVRISGDANGNNRLDLTETWRYTAAYVVPPDAPALLINTARVTATDALSREVTASATHSTIIGHQPALTLTKSGPISATVGQVVTFNFAVSHAALSDRSPITGVTVVDDFAGPASLLSGDDGDGWLEWGETWQFLASYVVAPTTPNPFTNVGLAAGLSSSSEVVTATASHTMQLSGFDPELFIDQDGPTQAVVGDVVEFTYTVINVNLLSLAIFGFDELRTAAIGDGSPLSNVTVTDSVAGPATFVSGDFNQNGWLDAAEAWVFTANHTIAASDSDPLVSVSTARARDAENDIIIATDTVSIDILHQPALLLQSTAPATATVGEAVDLTLTVSHSPGSDNSALTITSVNNNPLGPGALLTGSDANGNSLLDSGEVWRYAFNYTVKNSDYPLLAHTSTLLSADEDGDVFSATLTGNIEIERASAPGDQTYYLPLIFKRF